VNNRGRATAVPFSFGTKPVAATEIDHGDGYLLERGWTIAWCGWQWDMLGEPGLLGLRAPEAKLNGESITGPVRVDFRSEMPIPDHPLADIGALYAFRPYPAADLDQTDAVLTVRDGVSSAPRVVDRAKWRFAHDEHGHAVPDATSIWLEGGFEPHRFYEVVYNTDCSPVVGVGLLATRDFVSLLRFGRDGVSNPVTNPITHAFGHGISQTGRYLRHFVWEGLNLDESGRQVFDGILPHIAGARRGEFNIRYGQPSHIGYSGVAVLPPYALDESPGLFDYQRQIGGVPKMIAPNTAWEYWRSDACLNHIDPMTSTDRDEAADHRFYLFAGIDHLGDSPLKAQMSLANPTNPLGYALLLRAAFENLVAWVVDGTEPPPSRVPRILDQSATTREHVLQVFAGLPGVMLADAGLLPLTKVTEFDEHLREGVAVWPPAEGAALACYVSAVDEDGNETAGERLPEVAVPIATYSGWNSPDTGEAGRHPLQEFAGTKVAFARTRAEREESKDPRSSIEERYLNRSAYEVAVRTAVATLIADRLMLGSDEGLAVDTALNAYDRAVITTRTARRARSDAK
jgi:hypothetical protein